ncbi:hypothetical protein F8388_024532 [Cannabis sativa]|uniref:Rieske domain-containing protein n=1 Tax=Cannabis sativa TaxID=3483 RepID=A0A7J6GDI4_CANSA|nr:hypothetical protein F8388_024532 [Cannabis sativa]
MSSSAIVAASSSSSYTPTFNRHNNIKTPPKIQSLSFGVVQKTISNVFTLKNSKRGISVKSPRQLTCKAAEVSVAEESSSSGGRGENWIPVVPLSALPKGERRVIIQDGETILLLWYKNQLFAIENRSPAEGAYSEGLLNAKLTQDGCIVCPSTESTFDLRTGEVKECISGGIVKPDEVSAEIVFSGKAQPGVTASDVNVEEVRMVVDESSGGFGFTGKNEIINGKAAVIGFLLLLDFELLTGKGILKGTGFLDFIYSISNALQ